MKRVIIESPYAGNVERNCAYLRECILDSLSRGEAPFASHAFYTLFLDDLNPAERKQGMRAGTAWMGVADLVAVYTDKGISPGMEKGIALAEQVGIPIVERRLIKDAIESAIKSPINP